MRNYTWVTTESSSCKTSSRPIPKSRDLNRRGYGHARLIGDSVQAGLPAAPQRAQIAYSFLNEPALADDASRTLLELGVWRFGTEGRPSEREEAKASYELAVQVPLPLDESEVDELAEYGLELLFFGGGGKWGVVTCIYMCVWIC